MGGPNIDVFIDTHVLCFVTDCFLKHLFECPFYGMNFHGDQATATAIQEPSTAFGHFLGLFTSMV